MPLASDFREMMKELREYRGLLYSMTRRDLLLRYTQTVMGVGWAVFNPVLNMIIFSIIFTRVAPLDTGLPYPLYAYLGLLPWNMFASSVRFAATSLTSNTQLVTKVYFPREIFPFSAILVSLVDFAVGFLLAAALMLYYGVGVSWTILLLPFVVLVQLLFTAAISLLVAMGNLFYRDVKYLFEVIVTVWMFATSVLYPVERIGGRLGTFMLLNPMTTIIDAYRSVIALGEVPDPGPFLTVAAISAVLFFLAWVGFHRAEFKFAELI